MPKLTKQQYYDLLVEKSKQGRFPCSNPKTGQCFYRKYEDGCAIGVIMPDEVYRPDFDNGAENGIDTIMRSFNLKLDTWVPNGMNEIDLANIQSAHDSYAWNWDHEKFVKHLDEIFWGGQS